jgi:hypothetical protein
MRREPVARALQLLEAQQARTGERTASRDRRDVREARGDGLRELALEPLDLPPQRAPRGSLIGSGKRL